MTGLLTSILVLVLLAVVGCANPPRPASALLEPEAQLTMQDGGVVIIRIGATNASAWNYPANEAFNGMMEVRNATGDLRSRIDVHQFGALGPKETAMPAELKTQLDAGTYRLTWSAPTMQVMSLEFEVLDRDGKRYLRAESHHIRPYTEYTIGEARPVAAPEALNRP